MALAIDGSSPAVAINSVSTTATVTTLSFTPPAGALLLIGWAGNTGTASDPAAPTITDNLGVHISYTQIGWKHRTSPAPTVDGQAAMWWGVVGSSAAMTVTVTTGTGSGAQEAALKVWVITGQDPSTPISTTAKGATGSTSAASIAQSYTATATGGWGFLAVCDWDLKGAQTAGAGCTVDASANILTDITYAFARRTTADDSNGASNALNTTLPGTSTNLAWVYAEVQPSAGAAAAAMLRPQISTPAAWRPAGQALVARPAADPVLAAQPIPVPVATPGRPGARTGSAWTAVPRAEPSPLQNQPLPPVLVVTGRPPPPTGSAVVLTGRADPSPADPQCSAPFMSIGRPGPLAAAVTVLTPRADPSPAQNQPLAEPVISTGRPPAPAGAALLTAPRSDPPAATPPAPPPVVSTGRPLAAVGAGIITAPRTDTTADQPPAPAVLAPGPALRRPPGSSVTARVTAEETRAAPADVLVAMPGRAWSATPAVLTRSTFTGPAPVLVVRAPLITIGFRPRLAGMAWFGHAVSGVGHVCPPPTARPDTGTTTRPDSGLTLFGGALTGRPDTGTTIRPDTGVTPIC